MARTVHILAAALLLACAGGASEGGGGGGERTPEADSPGAEAATCPATAPAPRPLPGVTDAHLTLAYWLERATAYGDPEAPLLTPAQIEAHNRAIADDPENGLPTDRASLAEAPPADRLTAQVRERLAYLREKVRSGDYVDAAGEPLAPEAVAPFDAEDEVPVRARPELRVALADVPLRCGPRLEGLFRTPVDPDFDRNNCSTVRAQEPVQVLMRWPGGLQLARTRYSLGWIAADAPLSPALPASAADAVLRGRHVRVPAGTHLVADDGASASFPDGALLPRDPEDATKVLFADGAGLHRAPKGDLPSARRPLTRRAVLEEAFARLDRPYGWGGQDGGLDCSRFVMDVLATFGLELPRHSGRQAGSGTYAVDVSAMEDLEERLRFIEAANRRGIVLLHFPGHVMLYLGRDAEGTPRVIHSFSEYVEPCDDAGEGEGEAETLRRVDRVTVSDLSLGAGSSRGSFLERIERVVVLGQRIGPGLIAVAEPRAPAPVTVPEGRACDDSLDVRVFRSPRRPNVRQPLRVFVTSTRELGPVQLALVDPEGRRHTPEVERLGGPPFTYWAQIERPRAGRWTVVLGDGPNVAACERLVVSRYPPQPEEVDPEAVWTPRFRWEADTEALFSAFVEKLFDFPIEEDRTWPNLSVLLTDPAQNLLFDHLSQGEDARIPLRPDCADLPYFLRTYFAWKLRLPFGFRTCTRGRHGRLPVCDEELRTPQWTHEETDSVEAFRRFIRTQVKRGVHSASGRTHPEDSQTPLYPVPLTREALRPGTVFADPYGHLLVVARWIPQRADRYGILVGADAQPDGTVGRRRFWRGSFLFHPDTTHVGAGFKAWRPIVYDAREETYRALPNEEITAEAGYVPFSMEQYEGTTDDFYERMDALINPRPLDPVQVQLSLIDALDEAVARRVVSVDNGERWIAAHPGRTMEMPEGGAIFQTGGPWEEFSTPSRDMRLLIAMDTVTGFPDVVRRNPARFGVTEATVDAAVERTRRAQEEELARRTFAYTRSDGREQQLSLADVVARARGFEMSYNPNDCIEIRWAAPEGSEERASCNRHAPAEHRARMRQYREWFATRQRPIY
jgi:cell wall-associated NlpC family hydrolase